MKNLIADLIRRGAGKLIVLQFVFIISFTFSMNANAAVVTIGSQDAENGQTINVPVMMREMPRPVAGITLIGINFDNTLLRFKGYSNSGVAKLSQDDAKIEPSSIKFLWIDERDSPIVATTSDVIITSLDFDVITSKSTTTKIYFSGLLDFSDSVGYSFNDVKYVDAVVNLNKSSELPASPRSVVASAGNAMASIQFTPGPVGTSSSPISKFIVSSYPYGIQASGQNSPITISGLRNGTIYTFRVQAVDSNDNRSIMSDESNAVRPVDAKSISSPPTNLRATPSNSSVNLSWNAPNNLDALPFGVSQTSSIVKSILSVFKAPSRLTDYVIDYRVTGATTTWIRYNDGVSTNTYATVYGLTNGTEYEFIVSAEVNGVIGSASEVVKATPRDPNTRLQLSISANPNPVNYNSLSNVNWEARNASKCKLLKNSQGSIEILSNNISFIGSTSSGPISSFKIFTIDCAGIGGDVSSSSVMIIPAAIPAGGGSGVPIKIEAIEDEIVVPVPENIINSPIEEKKIKPASSEAVINTFFRTLTASILYSINQIFNLK